MSVTYNTILTVRTAGGDAPVEKPFPSRVRMRIKRLKMQFWVVNATNPARQRREVPSDAVRGVTKKPFRSAMLSLVS